MGEKKPVNWLAYLVTLIVHLLFAAATVYIVVLCAQRNYSLTVLHAACFTVGCGLLMTEAVLVVSGEAVLVAIVSRPNRIRIHWLLNGLGLALVITGFVAIVTSKIQSNSAHFTTDHGKVGLTAIIVSLVVALTAIPMIQTRLMPRIVSLLCMKLLHICFGICGIILLLTTQILGIQKGWWSGTELGRDLTFAAYVIGAFLLLIKPLHSWGSRVYGTMN